MPCFREQIIEIAKRAVGETDSQQEDEIKASFDEGNREWLRIRKELEHDEPEAEKRYRKLLDHRDYQAVHLWHDPPSIGGTYWVFVDTKTGEIIACEIGL